MNTDEWNNNVNLIESLQKGDQKAYAYIIDLYFDKLCIYAFALSRNKAISENIVQNILLKISNPHPSTNSRQTGH